MTRFARYWPVVLLVSGCISVSPDGGFIFTDFEGQLDDRLRPGGQELWGFHEWVLDARLAGFHATNDDVHAALDPYPRQVDEGPDAGFITDRSLTLAPDGTGGLAVVSVEYTHYERVATLASGAALADLFCDATPIVRVTRTADASSGETALTSQRLCGGALRLGVGPEPDTVVVVDLDDRESWLVSAEAGVGSALEVTVTPFAAALGGSLDPEEVVWVEAADATHLVAVGFGPAGWRFLDVAGAVQVADGVSGAPLGVMPVRRMPDGTLEVTTSDGWYTWDADGGGAVTPRATAPAPGSGAWLPGAWHAGGYVTVTEPNPLEPDLDRVVAVEALLLEDGVFRAVDVPTTPCSTEPECREIGESRFLGLAGEPGAYHAVYELWSWYLGTGGGDQRGVFSAPIDGASVR